MALPRFSPFITRQLNNSALPALLITCNVWRGVLPRSNRRSKLSYNCDQTQPVQAFTRPYPISVCPSISLIGGSLYRFVSPACIRAAWRQTPHFLERRDDLLVSPSYPSLFCSPESRLDSSGIACANRSGSPAYQPGNLIMPAHTRLLLHQYRLTNIGLATIGPFLSPAVTAPKLPSPTKQSTKPSRLILPSLHSMLSPLLP